MSPRASFVRAIDWATTGVWLKADTHIHTRFSDGGVELAEVVRQGQAHGCNVLAITDHADADRGATSEDYFHELDTARRANPNLVLLAGLEWNVPPWNGREHACVLVPPGPHERKLLRDFQSLFDDYHRAGEGRDPALVHSALRWLHTNSPGASGRPVVIYNHPSRKRSSSTELVAELADLQSENDLTIGFEGAPGHQDSQPIGAYQGTLETIDRWDPAAAVVGDAWDQLLARGLPTWGAIAASDFHSGDPNRPDDFWPGEFSETWLYARDSSAAAALQALRSGTFFAAHGHIVRKVEFGVWAEGLPRLAVAGEAVRVSRDTSILVILEMQVPLLDWRGQPNRIDEIELIAITPTKAEVISRDQPTAGGTWQTRLPVPDGGFTLRARGRRKLPEGPDLMFYTNPIQVLTDGLPRPTPVNTVVAAARESPNSVAQYPKSQHRTLPAWVLASFVIGAGLLVTLTDRWRIEVVRRFSRDGRAGRSPVHTQPHAFSRHFLFALLSFSLLAAYGSLVPLHWVQKTWPVAVGQLGEVLSRSPTFESRTDWATNILLFVPIGFFATGLLLGRRSSDRRRAVALPVVAGGCVLLSVAIEFAQLWTNDRTCSQNDIVAEGMGGLLGSIIWLLVGSSVVHWLDLWHEAQRPRQRLEHFLEFYLFVVVAYMLMPLDLTLRPTEIHNKLQAGRLNIVPFRDLITHWTSAIQVLGDVLLIVPLGVLVAIWRWPATKNVRPFRSSVVLGATIVVAMEASQILVMSRFSSTTDLLTGILGIAIGWQIARWCCGSQAADFDALRCRRNRLVLRLLIAAYIAVLVGLFCLPFERVSSSAEVAERLQGLISRPLLTALYVGTQLNAVSEILRKVLLFGLLGSLCGLTTTFSTVPVGRRRAWLVFSWLLCVLVAGGIELLQVWLLPHVPDLTDIFLGAAGAALGLAAVAWLSTENAAGRFTAFEAV